MASLPTIPIPTIPILWFCCICLPSQLLYILFTLCFKIRVLHNLFLQNCDGLVYCARFKICRCKADCDLPVFRITSEQLQIYRDNFIKLFSGGVSIGPALK